MKLNSINSMGRTAVSSKSSSKNELFSTIEKGNTEAAMALIFAGADVNAINEFGDRPLELAEKKGYKDLVHVLVSAGAKVNEDDYQIESPNTKMVNVKGTNFVSAGAKVNEDNHQIALPNTKMINVKGTDFKVKIHYDKIDKTGLLMIEKYVNYIFDEYKKRYTLDSKDTTFETYIYNNFEDYNNAHPWTRDKAGAHASGPNQYMPYSGDYPIGETLAHEYLFRGTV